MSVVMEEMLIRLGLFLGFDDEILVKSIRCVHYWMKSYGPLRATEPSAVTEYGRVSKQVS